MTAAAILSPRPRRVGAKNLLPPADRSRANDYSPLQPPKAKPTTHLAAIHVLASKCGLSDGDYRCLLRQLTGKESAKLLSLPEREKVREHLQLLARRMGVGSYEASSRYRSAASKSEKKIWALWAALHRAGKVSDARAGALMRFVKRQTGVDHLRFTNEPQRQRLIEALKSWLARA